MKKIFKIIFSALILTGSIGSMCLALTDKSALWFILSFVFSLCFCYNVSLLAKHSCVNVNDGNVVKKQGDNVITMNGSFGNSIVQTQ